MTCPRCNSGRVAIPFVRCSRCNYQQAQALVPRLPESPSQRRARHILAMALSPGAK